MKRPSPLLQMTLALVAMCSTLVLLAHLFFGVLPDRESQARAVHVRVGEILGGQVASLLQAGNARALKHAVDDMVQRTEGVLSAGLRRADGRLEMQAGDHERRWNEQGTEATDRVAVSIEAGGERWGRFEVVFRRTTAAGLKGWLDEPLVVLLLFFATAGTAVLGLYMRRALQHLDPASVIPERVQLAFDVMAEGVVVLDARGRLLLANKSFRNLYPDAGPLRMGRSLSALPWLVNALPADSASHPWTRAMSERAANAGHVFELAGGSRGTLRLVINCAPIADAGGKVMGCLATFNDVSELHETNQALNRSNDALKATLAALSAAKEEVESKNHELRRLAMRDPMTGCLNRRSFNEEFETMFRAAQAADAPLSVIVLDIDHFKRVNDTFGHPVGDRVIQEVARNLQAAAREGELVCRYGGEEFCIALPGQDLEAAMATAERIRVRVERECAVALREYEGMKVTISLGVDALGAETPTTSALIDRADQGLYLAKRGGRNRVCSLVLELAT